MVTVIFICDGHNIISRQWLIPCLLEHTASAGVWDTSMLSGGLTNDYTPLEDDNDESTYSSM